MLKKIEIGVFQKEGAHIRAPDFWKLPNPISITGEVFESTRSSCRGNRARNFDFS